MMNDPDEIPAYDSCSGAEKKGKSFETIPEAVTVLIE